MKLYDNRHAENPRRVRIFLAVADLTALCTLDFATGLVGVEVEPALAELARWHEGVSARPSARA